MKRAENTEGSCLQMNSTECEGYAGAQSAVRPERGETESRQLKLLEAILDRDNLNRVYKRVKANKGAPGVDGMTVEEALPWLKEHGKELRESIREKVQAGAGEAEGDTEARRRSTEAGDTDGKRPDYPTGDRSTVDAAV